MIANLREVFLRLRLAKRLILEKLLFLKKKIKYFNHMISPEGITTDPGKVIAVAN